MTDYDYHQHIHRDPNICGGEPVFRGTRVLLRIVLASIAQGDTIEVLQREFPSLTDDHYRAAISFAAASAVEDIPAPPPPFREAV